MKVLDVDAWPAELQAQIAPRRGGYARPIDPRPWEELRARVLATVPTSVEPALVDAAAEVDAYVAQEERPTTPLRPLAGAVLAARAVDGVILAIGRRTMLRSNEQVGEALVDHLVLAGGLSHAAEVLVLLAHTVTLHEGVLRRARRAFWTGIDAASLRLRAHVAIAPDDAYEAARDRAAQAIAPAPSIAALVLARAFPGEDFAVAFASDLTRLDPYDNAVSRPVAATVHLDASRVGPLVAKGTHRAALTLLAQCGPSIVDVLLAQHRSPQATQALALVEDERAFGVVLEHAVVDSDALPWLELAIRTWPALAERELARRTEGPSAALARLHLRRLRSLGATAPSECTSPDEIPALLRSPPWHAGKTNAKPTKPLTGLVLPAFEAEPRAPTSSDPRDTSVVEDLHVLHMLRVNRWPASLLDLAKRGDPSLPTRVRAAFDEHHGTFKLWVLRRFPRPLAAALEVLPSSAWIVEPDEVELLLALRGLGALDLLIRLAEGHADAVLGGAVLCSSPRLAPVAAAALRKKKARQAALAWLDRHPRAAAIGLLADALGPKSPGLVPATEALSWLARRGHLDVLLDVARETQPDVRAALEKLLARDLLLDVPVKRPTLPAFADPAMVPPLALVRGATLPRAPMLALLEMLAFSGPEEPYAGVARVRDAFDPESLAAWSWELFESWRAHGMPSKESWALSQLSWLGGAREAGALAQMALGWPNPGETLAPITISTACSSAVDVLARMDLDEAVDHLFMLEREARAKVSGRAYERLEQIADERGLTLQGLRRAREAAKREADGDP